MKILLIDTCGIAGSIALADTELGPAAIAGASLPGRGASERLVGAIRELAEQSLVDLHSLGAIAVVLGPGSFTGVRVGLSAAKGLCEALGVPVVGISRLAVLAGLARPCASVYALLDAGRGDFYMGEYRAGKRIREALLSREQLLAELQSGRREFQVREFQVVYCEAAVAQSLAELAPELVAEPAAADACPLALERIRAGDFDDAATLDANYLRRTDAEIFAKPRPAEPAKILA